MEISPLRWDRPVTEALPVPFWDVTIHRPMRRFGSSLCLLPNLPSSPPSDLIAAVILGRRSFSAWLRSELGGIEFRNLRNFALGKVRNPRTLGHVLAKCGNNMALVDELAAMLRDPESASLVRLMQAGEGAVYRLIHALHSVPVPCPCCNANVIPSSPRWWEKQACVIGQPEADFIDRLCMVSIGMHAIINLRGDAGHTPPPSLLEIADAQMHPNGNWLQAVGRAFASPNLSHLAARAGAAMTPDSVLRVSRGDSLTPEAVAALTQHVDQGGAVRAAAATARLLALAIEFLMAAHTGPELSEEVARKIVEGRIATLGSDLDLIGRYAAKDAADKKKVAAQTDSTTTISAPNAGDAPAIAGPAF